jgi:PTH1 family peptidyl-tRNA hydrolase
MQYLDSEEIPRLRIGIGSPLVNFNFDYVSYVLSNFNNEEKDKIGEVIQLSTDAIKTVIEDGFEKAMRKYNRKLLNHN